MAISVISLIVDKMDDTHFYADISTPTGAISTMHITIADIESVFEEIEHIVAFQP